MDTPSRSFPGGDIRVSDADRDRAVAELSEHFQTGRLTQEEFEDRSGQALRARTGRELSELFTDLPQGMPPAPVSPGSVRHAPVAGVVVGCVVVASVVANVLGSVFGYAHSRTVSFGWLVPVLIVWLVFRRRAIRRR